MTHPPYVPGPADPTPTPPPPAPVPVPAAPMPRWALAVLATFAAIAVLAIAGHTLRPTTTTTTTTTAAAATPAASAAPAAAPTSTRPRDTVLREALYVRLSAPQLPEMTADERIAWGRQVCRQMDTAGPVQTLIAVALNEGYHEGHHHTAGLAVGAFCPEYLEELKAVTGD